MLRECNAASRCLILSAVGQFKQANMATAGGYFGVGQCVEELLKAKRVANRTTRYTDSLASYLKKFCSGRETKPICEFSLADIEEWLARYNSPYTRQTWLNRISTLFSFAVRRGYVTSNPCDRVERVTVDKKAPQILTPAQAKEVYAACPTICRPYLVLALYAGIRPEETMRLNWGSINLETKTVAVEGKTRRRRLVPLEPIAVELLSRHPLKSGPVSPSLSTLRRWKDTVRQIIGASKFPQDLLRHTAASYLLAKYEDAGKVSMWLGNSSKILLAHYHNPVSQADCAVFWKVQPSSLAPVPAAEVASTGELAPVEVIAAPTVAMAVLA